MAEQPLVPVGCLTLYATEQPQVPVGCLSLYATEQPLVPVDCLSFYVNPKFSMSKFFPRMKEK